MQIIGLCGCDMTGKSHIAKELSRRTGIPVYKASTEHTAFLSAKQERFINDIRYACPARLDLLKQLDANVIQDRFYPCELAYSKFFGRPTDMDAIKYLDEEYAKLGAVIVLCTRKSFIGICDDLDPRLNEAALVKLNGYYDEFYEWTKCHILRLFVDDEDLGRECDEIMSFVRGVKENG